MKAKKIMKRLARAAVRQTARAVLHGDHRRTMHRAGAVLMMLAGARILKMSQRDFDEIARVFGISPAQMDEDQLAHAMDELHIDAMPVQQQDRQQFVIPQLPEKCSSCTRPLSMDEVDWAGPMSAKCPSCGIGIQVTWQRLA